MTLSEASLGLFVAIIYLDDVIFGGDDILLLCLFDLSEIISKPQKC